MIDLFGRKARRKQQELAERELAAREAAVEVERQRLAQSRRLMVAMEEEQSAKAAPPEYKAPWLPAGVVPEGHQAPVAMDSCANVYQFAGDADANFFPAFIGYPRLAMLSQSSDYRSVPETISTEMTRKWGRFKVSDTAALDDDTLTELEREQRAEEAERDDRVRKEKIAALEMEFERHDIRTLVRRAIETDLTMGRAQIYIDLGATDDSLPFVTSPVGVRKGALKGFTLIEPMWSTPSLYNANDPTRPDFYVPERWYVMGREVHADRLITMVMRPVPDILKPAYNFGGISMLQLMIPYVQRYQRTSDSISELIHSFSLSILATDMSAILAGNLDPNLLMRMSLFNKWKSNNGLMILDKNEEEISQINTPLSGLHELWTKSQEQMAGPSHIPMVKLLGVTPSGLNANSDGEIRVFYDYIMAQNEAHVRPVIERISEIMQLSLFGEVDRGIRWEFDQLYQLNDKELAEVQEIKARTVATLIDGGLVSQEEGRAALSADEQSMFSGIPVAEVPEAQEYDAFEV